MQTRVRGFENTLTNRAVLPNGTFIHSHPCGGGGEGNELDDKNKRKRFGLKEKDLMPALERNCVADCRDSYISNNSDWVNVETVISTSPTRSRLRRARCNGSGAKTGRRYFQYKLDHMGLNYYSFLSARYEVARTEWNGINIEVYYLKEQPWNIPKMLNSVKKSLSTTPKIWALSAEGGAHHRVSAPGRLRRGFPRHHAVLGVHRLHRQHPEAG